MGDFGTLDFVADRGRFVRGGAAIFREIAPFCSELFHSLYCGCFGHGVSGEPLTLRIVRTDVLFVKPCLPRFPTRLERAA